LFLIAAASPPSSSRFLFALGQHLPVAIAHDEAGVGLLDGPGRWEAAGFGHEAR
jgi:hypothetical protein